MHEGEIIADPDLVRRLLAAQFGDWASLPLKPVASAGTDNAIYRLGSDMLVRLPRIEWAVTQVEKEQAWLPRLAPQLPLAIPVPLGMGVPGEGYPWPWSIYTWLAGQNATIDRMADPVEAAQTLAGFLRALHSIDTTGGPPPGAHNFRRGVPLADRDDQTREAIAALADQLDTEAATRAWEEALSTPPLDSAAVWIHGDLQSGNLLATDGHLTGVIDFGGLAVGDPACDLLAAWNLFSGPSRAALRQAMAVDDTTWARGRGWALSVALIQLPYYQHTNPYYATSARQVIAAVLEDLALR